MAGIKWLRIIRKSHATAPEDTSTRPDEGGI
jgi:hypothetical protein